MKNVAIIGSTGSIGTQTLEIVRVQEDLNIVALAAGSNIELLEKQARGVLAGCVRVVNMPKDNGVS